MWYKNYLDMIYNSSHVVFSIYEIYKRTVHVSPQGECQMKLLKCDVCLYHHVVFMRQ